MFALKESNNDDQINYEIHRIFKTNYQKAIQHKRELSFDEIIQSSFNVLGIEYSGFSFPEIENWFQKTFEMSFLNTIIRENTEEVIFHSPEVIQHTKSDGTNYQDISSLNLREDYNLMLETLCQKNGIDWNTKEPFVSFKTLVCNSQYRVTLVHESTLSTSTHKAFFRVLRKDIFKLDSFTTNQDLIQNLVNKKSNILISGATGSGKTSFTKSLLTSVDSNEHVILLEDTEELASELSNFTCMLANNSQGYSLKSYCEYSMRMRPDRLILGEMRSHEVVPFLLSMNNGHKGLMTTIHANNAQDAITRAALLFEFYSESKSITFEQILKLITKDLDYVIHLDKKRVTEIIKVIGYSNQQIRFETIYSGKD
jgi:type IV secretion system protein VirB11